MPAITFIIVDLFNFDIDCTLNAYRSMKTVHERVANHHKLFNASCPA